ncbi:MAG: hypothetical protein N2C14_18715, partial [Planctomycetales bacterium]
GAEVLLEEATGTNEAVKRLRDDVFDVVLAGHVPGELDAIALMDALQGARTRVPVIVFGHQDEIEAAEEFLAAGADAYVCLERATGNLWLWAIARAMERGQLEAEKQRLASADRQRLQKEQDEAQRLLQQQHELIGKRSPEDRRRWGNREGVPNQLADVYRDLLRAYVIMGSGNLTREIQSLASLLVSGGASAADTLELHVEALRELIQGLGSRGRRHLMVRADLLAMETLSHLAEGYRLRPPRAPRENQPFLPGFDEQEELGFFQRDRATGTTD